jgi:putative PEP-CTERM system TPR-repeat lipoprotein
MRRVLLLGLPIIVLLGGGAVAYHFLHHGNLVQDAQRRFARGDVYGAELDLDSFLRRHPGDPKANYTLGLIYLGEDNPLAAERVLRQAIAGHYDAAAAMLPLGEAYLRQHKYDEALNDFTVEKAPKGAEASVQAIRASAYLGLHRLEEAKQAAAAGTQAAPESPDALLVAARVDLAGGDIKAAAAQVDLALARDPKRADALLLKAELAMHANQPTVAEGLARTVLAANPNRLDGQMALARALAAQHKDVQAAAIVDGVLKKAPRDVGANYLRVVLGVRQRDFQAADASLQVISSIIDELPQGDYFLAVTKLGRNQPAQAQEAAAKYAARNPNDMAGQKLLAFAELALHRPDNAMVVLKTIQAHGASDADTLDLLARAQAMQGNITGAEQNLAAASAMEPNNTEVLNRLAATKLDMGDVNAGKADLQRSLATTPDQPLAAMTLVQTLLAQGDLDQAQATIETLRKAVGDTELVGVLDAQSKVARLDLLGAKALYADVLKRFPANRDATFGLIQVEGRLGEAQTAEDRLSGWMSLHPTDKVGLRLQVKSLMAAGDKKAAIAAAEAAHAGSPSDAEVTELLASLYLSNKQPDEALALLDRVEGSATGVLALVRASALIQMHRLDDAATVLQNAITATPGDVRARFMLVQLDMQQKKPDAARDVLQAGLTAAPGNPQLLQGMVGLELKQNGIKAALAEAATLQKDPQNMPGALQLPGGVLTASGDLKGAADAYLAAYKQAPSVDLAVASASALVKAGRAPEARALLEAWTAQHPDDVPALELLSSIAVMDHRLDDAAPLLERVLKLRPNNAPALNNMAWVRLQHGDAKGAKAYAMRAFYLAPGPETQDTLGWTIDRLGQAGAAVTLLEQSAAVRPTPSILYHYAAALYDTGRKTDAKAAVDKALAGGKPFDERKDAEALQAKVSP